jgi:hypothetical protein
MSSDPVLRQALEIRRNEDGSLDEIVAHDVTIHLEQMSGGHWWMSIESAGRLFHVNFTARRATIIATVEDA